MSPCRRIRLTSVHMFERFRNGAPTPRGQRTTEVEIENGHMLTVERAQMLQPALVLLEGDLPGQVFRLSPGRHVIGRKPDCDIRLRGRAVSGVHAEAIRVNDSVTMNDLASTNGTLVNGLRIRMPVMLSQGNLIKVGNCVFRYVDSLLEVEFTETLHERGTKDQLTGAYNNSYLTALLAFALDCATEATPVSVIAFDFDDFKLVNDRYGHAAGDQILRATSTLIRDQFVREGDLFARMGGEEFTIVLPDTSLETATGIAEAIRETLEQRLFEVEDVVIGVTSSFGVASTTTSAEPPESLLARADELLYRSKREGRNRVSV